MRVAAMLVLVALSGCLVSDDDGDVRTGEADQQVRTTVADQLVGSFTGRLSPPAMNVERVGYSNGVDNIADPNRIPQGVYYTEIAHHPDGYVYIARGTAVEPTQPIPAPICGEIPGQDEAHGGFTIINVQDPSHPQVLGSYNALTGSDIEISSDNRLAFFATQRNCLTEIAGNLATNEDPLDVLPRGIHIVDVSDPTAPELVWYQPLPVNGPHTITYFESGSREFLIASTYDLYEDPGTQQLRTLAATQRVLIFEIMRDPVGGTDNAILVPVNTFFLTDRASGDRLYFPHDAIPQVHPLTGQTLLYVAYWDKGLQLVDMSNLAAPLSVVDEFTEFSPSSHNAIHQVRAFDELIGDRHVTVTEPEIISADETGQFTILDTTDPTRITKLGHWTLPGELTVSNLDYSPHNFVLGDGKIFLAHNHAGFWVVDVSTEANLVEPKTVGYYTDVIERSDAPRLQPYFWGAQRDGEGLIYAVDEASGLYILRYTGP